MTPQQAFERLRNRQPVGFRGQFPDGLWHLEIRPIETRDFKITIFRTPEAGPEVQTPAEIDAFLIDIAKAFESGGHTFERLGANPGAGRN